VPSPRSSSTPAPTPLCGLRSSTCTHQDSLGDLATNARTRCFSGQVFPPSPKPKSQRFPLLTLPSRHLKARQLTPFSGSSCWAGIFCVSRRSSAAPDKSLFTGLFLKGQRLFFERTRRKSWTPHTTSQRQSGGRDRAPCSAPWAWLPCKGAARPATDHAASSSPRTESSPGELLSLAGGSPPRRSDAGRAAPVSVHGGCRWGLAHSQVAKRWPTEAGTPPKPAASPGCGEEEARGVREPSSEDEDESPATSSPAQAKQPTRFGIKLQRPFKRTRLFKKALNYFSIFNAAC